MPTVVLDEVLSELPLSRAAAALHSVSHLAHYSDDGRTISAIALMCASAPRMTLGDLATAFAALADEQPDEDPRGLPEPVTEEEETSPEFAALKARLAEQERELIALNKTLSIDWAPPQTIGTHTSGELRTLTAQLSANDLELVKLRETLANSKPGPVEGR